MLSGIFTFVRMQRADVMLNYNICDLLSENPALCANIEFALEAIFIRTGRFPAKLRLLHQRVTRLGLYHTEF